jgi:hypothetical protein
MDTTKLRSALETTQQELNTVIDGAVKSRNVNGLRSLTLAANHLADAGKHVEKAVSQAAPKAAKA